MKKDKKVLNRAEDVIVKYPDTESVYYQELVKSYNEYVNLSNFDKTTNELYINHIDGLCTMIVEKKHSNLIMLSLIILLLGMLILSTYSTINYYRMSKNINSILYRGNAVLSVNYGNMENFNALTLANMSEYKNLTPLTLSISSNSKSHEQMKYNIYLLEDNDEIAKEILLNRDVFLYNVKSKTRDSGIKALKDATIDDNKILIYSSTFDSFEKDDVEIRMWINPSSKDYQNKIYRFKIFVEGYV